TADPAVASTAAPQKPASGCDVEALRRASEAIAQRRSSPVATTTWIAPQIAYDARQAVVHACALPPALATVLEVEVPGARRTMPSERAWIDEYVPILGLACDVPDAQTLRDVARIDISRDPVFGVCRFARWALTSEAEYVRADGPHHAFALYAWLREQGVDDG